MTPPEDHEWLPDGDDGDEAESDPSADAPEGSPEDDLEAGLEGEESGGLGLTEEFARIEAEIQADADRDPAASKPDRASEPEPEPEEEHATGEWSLDEGEDSEPVAGQQPAADEAAAAGLHRRPEESDEPEVSAEPTGEGPDAEQEQEDEPEQELEGEYEEDSEPEQEDEHEQEDIEPDEEEPHEATPATEHTAVRPMARPVAAAAVGIPEEELEAKTPRLWLRFLAGSVLVVCSVAVAVVVNLLFFIEDIAADLQPIPGVQKQLSQVDAGAPQTIMIIGSDRRSGTDKGDKRSDTTMLVRLDPDKQVLSLFSLPRDLKVDIPGVGVDKLNAAYTAGGAELTVETVKRFMDIDVNHVVEINFNGFADAVNAIECVYIDVDRDYFNVNDGSVANDYADIDINSGYQRLCGLKALQYVRYRHTDTDLVRAARQQDFLREARQKVQPRELLGALNPFSSGGQGNELIDIFTDYTRSDIDDQADVIGILKSFIDMRNVPVNEVHFQGDIGGPDNPFVTSTDGQVKKAKDEFLNGAGSSGQRGGEKATEKNDGEKKKKKKKKKKDKDPTAGANVIDTEAVTDQKFPTLADRFAADAAKNSRRLGIPVFYPTRVAPGSSFSTGSRTYEYKNEDDKKESGYKTVIQYQPSFQTEYYGVMGTTWDDPPILRNPSETRKIDGREYLLFYDGGRLRLVGWRQDGNSYWLNNTLVQSIGEAEMLSIATTMREV